MNLAYFKKLVADLGFIVIEYGQESTNQSLLDAKGVDYFANWDRVQFESSLFTQNIAHMQSFSENIGALNEVLHTQTARIGHIPLMNYLKRLVDKSSKLIVAIEESDSLSEKSTNLTTLYTLLKECFDNLQRLSIATYSEKQPLLFERTKIDEAGCHGFQRRMWESPATIGELISTRLFAGKLYEKDWLKKEEQVLELQYSVLNQPLLLQETYEKQILEFITAHGKQMGEIEARHTQQIQALTSQVAGLKVSVGQFEASQPVFQASQASPDGLRRRTRSQRK